VLLLGYFGLVVGEIAERVGVPLGAVKSRGGSLSALRSTYRIQW
jgi:DNA-directed RNA polymerase specialized sigma24 family protein